MAKPEMLQVHKLTIVALATTNSNSPSPKLSIRRHQPRSSAFLPLTQHYKMLPFLSLTFLVVATIDAASAKSRAAPTSCGQTFCERSQVYPVSRSFQKTLELDPKLAFLKQSSNGGKKSLMADDDPYTPPEDPQIQLCRSKTELIFPQEAENVRGQRKFIINFGPFTQGVTIERCTIESFAQLCSYVGAPPNFRPICVQKDIEHRLTTIEVDPSGSVQTAVDVFKFPSYCACKMMNGLAALTGAPCSPVQQPPAPQYALSSVSQNIVQPSLAQNTYGAQGLYSNAANGYRSLANDQSPDIHLSARSDDLFANANRPGFPTSSNQGFSGHLPQFIH